MEDPAVALIRSVSQAINKTQRNSQDIQNLPKDAKDRLKALKVLHKQRAAIQIEYQKELYALEFKYAKLYATTYQQQRSILSDGKFDDAEDGTIQTQKALGDAQLKEDIEMHCSDEEPTTGGIPGYWPQVLRTAPLIREHLTDNDLKMLDYLVDIKCSYSKKLSSPGFRLLFIFKKNPFFKNNILVKQFVLSFFSATDDLNEFGPMKVTASKTSDVEWIQPHKTKGEIDDAQRSSFFDIFREQHPASYESPDYAQLLEDYELCIYIRDRILPYSVYWYTGEVMTS